MLKHKIPLNNKGWQGSFLKTRLFVLAYLLMVFSCRQSSRYVTSAELIKSHPASRSSLNCDYNIWSHVYNPSRLKIIDTCISVSGTIVESNADEDGDQHMLLKLDNGLEHLLTNRNMEKKGGNLVIEAICINNIYKNKVGDACEGYINNVDLPKLKDKVMVTGSLVIDTHNGWSEIHPISKIDIIK